MKTLGGMECRSRLFCSWQAQRYWGSVAGAALLGIVPLRKRGWYGAAGYSATEEAWLVRRRWV